MKKNKSLDTKFCMDVLKKIKKDKVKQTPKIIFFLKYLILWIILFHLLMIGALSISLTFDYLLNADWSLLNKIGFIKIVTIFIPISWFIVLLFTTILSYYNFINTEKGYKLTFIKVLILNIFLSGFIGGILFFTGFNSYIESKIERKMPQYREMFVKDKISRMIQVWQNENKGLIIGEIKSISNTGLLLKDYNNKKWNIHISMDNKTIIKTRVKLIVGEKIKIIGKKLDKDNDFIAEEIRPFIGKRHIFK